MSGIERSSVEGGRGMTPTEALVILASPSAYSEAAHREALRVATAVEVEQGRGMKEEAMSEPRTVAQAMLAALADVTAAYHHERKHDGHWTKCQRPRCQNARLATEGRGPFLESQP